MNLTTLHNHLAEDKYSKAFYWGEKPIYFIRYETLSDFVYLIKLFNKLDFFKHKDVMNFIELSSTRIKYIDLRTNDGKITPSASSWHCIQSNIVRKQNSQSIEEFINFLFTEADTITTKEGKDITKEKELEHYKYAF